MRLLYSRDGIAPAVRDLEKVLSMIRSGEFCPDHTRSGYFPGQAVEPIDSEAPEDPLLHVPVSESEPSEDEEDNGCDQRRFAMIGKVQLPMIVRFGPQWCVITFRGSSTAFWMIQGTP